MAFMRISRFLALSLLSCYATAAFPVTEKQRIIDLAENINSEFLHVGERLKTLHRNMPNKEYYYKVEVYETFSNEARPILRKNCGLNATLVKDKIINRWIFSSDLEMPQPTMYINTIFNFEDKVSLVFNHIKTLNDKFSEVFTKRMTWQDVESNVVSLRTYIQNFCKEMSKLILKK